MRRFLLTVALSLLTVPPATAAETVDAVWKEHKVDVRFIGLATAYSCDLMKAKIEILLRHLGAHEIQVTVPTCAGFTYPQKDHRIFASFLTVVVAGEGDVDIVRAAWSEVELGKRHPRSIDDQDCELLESFQKNVLVTIEHEVIDGMTACGASRRSVAGRLKLKVLKPIPEDGESKKNK